MQIAGLAARECVRSSHSSDSESLPADMASGPSVKMPEVLSELPGGCPHGACVQEAARRLSTADSASRHPGWAKGGYKTRQVPHMARPRTQGLPAIVLHTVVHQFVGASVRHQADTTMSCSSPAWAIARDQQSTQQADLLVRSEWKTLSHCKLSRPDNSATVVESKKSLTVKPHLNHRFSVACITTHDACQAR